MCGKALRLYSDDNIEQYELTEQILEKSNLIPENEANRSNLQAELTTICK